MICYGRYATWYDTFDSRSFVSSNIPVEQHWGSSIQQLLRYWSQLETRTKQTVDFLQAAAEGRCAVDGDGPPSSKAERKKRDKRKKALDTLEELLSRIGTARTTGIQSLYEPLVELLRERAEMRRLWQMRENDHVFRELDRLQRPLPVPFEFDVDIKSNGSGVSPMPEDLLSTADRLVALGRACVSGDIKYLPADCTTREVEALQEKGHAMIPKTLSPVNEHCQSITWPGWNSREFGLEMQSPWAGLMLQRKKTIETRAYDLPSALLGKRIGILQSKQGGTTSALGNVVPITNTDPVVTLVGWCRFTNVIKYEDIDLFDADQDAHWVTKESSFYPFGNERQTKGIYGWVVGEVGLALNDTFHMPLNTIVRRYRSLFELQFDDSKVASTGTSNKKRKKRRRY